MIGLEQLSAPLVAKLRLAGAAKQRVATLAACEFAIARAAVKHPLVDEVLGELRAGRLFVPETKGKIEALTAQLDGEYFDLQAAYDEGRSGKGEYLRVFAKARAVAALSYAGGDDAFVAATEAIYEAAATIIDDDKRELFASVESALE